MNYSHLFYPDEVEAFAAVYKLSGSVATVKMIYVMLCYCEWHGRVDNDGSAVVPSLKAAKYTYDSMLTELTNVPFTITARI